MLPTLNIILYTDHPALFHEDPLKPRGGLIDLQAFICEKTKQFVTVNFELVLRHGADAVTGVELHGEKMITDQLLKDADELWVFGRRMKNKSDEPHNELEPKEIEILERVMGPERRIGIFVTGDHSESPDNVACEDSEHQEYLSLGRALGKGIPVAGLLRDWDGPPSNCIELPFEKRDNFNTQERGESEDLDSEFLENDEIPQKLVDETTPHPLFTFVDSSGKLQKITTLPDHAHEGIVFGPEDLDGNWPEDLPLPVVAARGKDKRFTDKDVIQNLVVAFDGDSVDRGRLVVDSSFHHYLDENTRKIPSRNAVTKLPDPDTELDQIAEFFGNLALWLAPKPIRDKIKFDILLSLARHETVLETLSLSDERVGKVARHILKSNIEPGRLEWLFDPSQSETGDPLDEFFSEMLLKDETSFRYRELMTPDLMLGSVMRICDHLLAKYRIADVTLIKQHKELWKPLWAGMLIGMESAQAELSKKGPESIAASNKPAAENELKGEKAMARRCKNKWDSFVNEKPDDLIDVRTDNEGKLKGKHIRSLTEIDFTGDCTEGPPHHINIKTNEGFEYDGDIFHLGALKIILGRRFALDKKGNRKKLNGDEVWVGVKTSD